MEHPQTVLNSCARQLARMTQNAATHRYRIHSLCKSLKESPERLWKLCQDALGKTPSDVMDWARAKAFVEVLKTDPNTKLRQLRRQLGYESESAFNGFAYRVFGCAPQGAKGDVRRAEKRVGERYKAIEECYERMMQRESGNPKPKQTKRVERVLTKQKTETESRNGIPKWNPEMESRNGKPKRNTETEYRNRFLLEKRKEESKIGAIPAIV